MANCLQCSKEIQIVDANSKYKKFCNRSCSGTYNNSRRKVNPEWFDSIRKERTCKVCKTSISEEYLKTYKYTKFCSEICKENAPRKAREREKALPAELPFIDKHYYIVVREDDRKSVLMHNSDGTKYKTMSYARYLMCLHLNRELEKEEGPVDHINNDRTDDRIENLQIISNSENNKKYAKEVLKGRLMVELICPCGVSFIRERRSTFLINSRNVINTYCSRKCPENGKNSKEFKTILVREFRKLENN